MSTPETPGDFSEWKEVDEEIKKICEKVKDDAEKKTYMQFTVYIPLDYRRKMQKMLVGKETFQIKVYVGKDLCLLIEVDHIITRELVVTLKNAAVIPLPTIIFNDTP